MLAYVGCMASNIVWSQSHIACDARWLYAEGGYEDAEHYLDVQFRLLREDFIRPLRSGRFHCSM